MVEIKTFSEVSNNVNRVGKGEGGEGGRVLLILSHINMAFAGFLPCHLAVLLVHHLYFHIWRQFFGKKQFLFNLLYCKTLNSSCR